MEHGAHAGLSPTIRRGGVSVSVPGRRMPTIGPFPVESTVVGGLMDEGDDRAGSDARRPYAVGFGDVLPMPPGRSGIPPLSCLSSAIQSVPKPVLFIYDHQQ